ncbi:MAG: hypothetical protein AAGA23_06450 [Pseudomonadota bacterium]
MRYLCLLITLLLSGTSVLANKIELKATIYLETETGLEVLLDGTTAGSFEFHSWEKHENYQGEPINILVGLDEQREVWIKAWISDASTHLSSEDVLIVDTALDATALVAATTPIYRFENGARVFVNTTPQLAESQPSPITLKAESMGLNYLCLNNSSVIVDDTFQLGRVSGFGARFTIDVPDFNLVTFSMIEFPGYVPIGEYDQGLIRIPLGQNELTINAVRFGASGRFFEGPFTIFGSLDPNEQSPQQSRSKAAERIRERLPEDKAQTLIDQMNVSPYAPLVRVTSSLMVEPTPQLERIIGPWGTELEVCGRY